MRKDRAALDRKDVELARQEPDFSSFYLTRNEGDARRQVMRQDIDISRRWRERHGYEPYWWQKLK
jgi:hypothetical protein